MSSVRVLVVDDYEPFRRFVCGTLEKTPELQIIGEVSDGLEAVHKSEELRPDLIVLDVGLPTLNGIQAARRILKLLPASKILFVSQESSADVVQEALSLGALGYVVKTHTGSELLAAVEAVLQGRQFLSDGLSSHNGSDMTGTPARRSLTQAGSPIAGTGKSEVNRTHEVEFHSDDAAFVVGFARFIEANLEAGNAVIVIVTESHQKSLLQRLREHGVDIMAAIEQGRYVPLDVSEILASFMGNDLPEPMRFFAIAGDLIAAATRTTWGGRVAMCGECGSILWAQGNPDAAIQVEQLCNQLAKRYEVDILCGFSLSSFCREEDKQIFQKICRE